jgi:hypothetical protein
MYQAQFNSKQEQALRHLSTSSNVEQVLYGGGVYGGKTWLGCYWQIARRLKHPHTRGLIGRAELKKLQLSTMLRFWEICTQMGLKAGEHYTYNGQLNMIRWFNGSETILMDMAATPSDPDFHRFGSLEITDYFLDEVAEMTKKAVDIIDTRVRYNLVGGIPKGLMSCNPSKDWLYNDYWHPWKKELLPPHKAFVEALMKDNTVNPDAVYEAKMMRLPEADRKRLLEGDWDYDESVDWIYQYEDLLRCFREEDSKGEKYISADIARLGKDRSVICVWHGLHLIEIHELRKQPITTVVSTIRQLCDRHGIKLSNVICDEDGVGGGVVDSLKCRGFLNGGRAKQADRYTNQKAECYFKLAELIEQNKVIFKVNQFRDVIVQELDMIRRRQPEADGKLAVISKDEIARRHGKSPDYADAIMMRMYFELFPNYGSYSWA